MMNRNEAFTLDSLAMRLAADMGQVWSDLCDFPGYARNRWRDEARQRVLKEMPGAVLEPLPGQWDGRDGGYIIKVAARAA